MDRIKPWDLMEENREISALLHLIDDPDDEVFTTVSERIVSLGKDIIPNLENLWENTPAEDVQERIELLIHRLHYDDLRHDLTDWHRDDALDLLAGALLVARYKYPDLQTMPVVQEIEKFRRNIWLELNSYLTALEQVNVVNKILFSYHKLKGVEISYTHQEEFLMNKVIETRRGNPITNGILYQYLCQMLDIPVKVINVPRQYILAYFDTTPDYFQDDPSPNKIHFYIDPMTGQVYTQKDVDNYYERLNMKPAASHFKPMSHRRMIRFLLEEYAKCFDDPQNGYKKEELLRLSEILSGPNGD
jgi:regulator of sirC expression with transglutaminase-like and TPR domain